MYLTEEEAKVRICPKLYAAIVGAMPGFIGQDGLSDGSIEKFTSRANCIASECMMWRQYGFTFTKEYMQAQGREHTKEEVEKSQKGYCGLGGKP